MGFTKVTANMNNHQSLGDSPNIDNGLTAEQLKVLYDKAPNDLKTAINRLIDELEGMSSAENIGASPLANGDTSSENVQAKLEYLLSAIQSTTLGQIPDGTITQAKMNPTYDGTLAKKDNTLQTGLNAEKLASNTLEQILAVRPYVVGNYAGQVDESDGPSAWQTINLGFRPKGLLIWDPFSCDSGNDSSASAIFLTSEKNTSTFANITDTGFSVYTVANHHSGFFGFNILGYNYKYIAFKA